MASDGTRRAGAAAGGRVDGRTARAQRTREAIVDALLALLDDGELRPTGERIAERAGVSLRALWANFKDMETLYAAAGERLIERQDAEFRPVPVDAPIPERIARFCQQRARMLEIVAPAARAAQLREPFSAQLRRNRATQIARTRQEITTLFAAELQAAGAGRERLLSALLVSCTWSAWSMLRDELGLDEQAAAEVMVRAVTALLTSALAASVP